MTIPTLDQLITQNLEATKKLAQAVDSLRLGQEELAQLRRGIITPFDVQKFDLTTAHTNLEVTVLPCAYIQAISDGELYGVTINLVRQGAYTIDLSQVSTISAGNVNKLYLTNDVRAGRNTLWLYFHRIEPFGTRYTGDPVTNAEVAARLGSISTFDRRGEVIWFDDFEDNFNKWLIAYTAGTGTATISQSYARNGAQSARLVTGATSDDDVYIQHWLPYSSIGRFGFEISFTLPSTACYIEFYLRLFTGSQQLRYAIKYDSSAGTLSYWNSAGAYASFATGIAPHAYSNLFHTAKLVVDFTQRKYARFILDNTTYDLSPYAGAATTVIGNPYLIAQFSPLTRTAASITSYIDDAIVTQNEP